MLSGPSPAGQDCEVCSEHMAKQLMLILSSALDEKELEHQEGSVDP